MRSRRRVVKTMTRLRMRTVSPDNLVLTYTKYETSSSLGYLKDDFICAYAISTKILFVRSYYHFLLNISYQINPFCSNFRIVMDFK